MRKVLLSVGVLVGLLCAVPSFAQTDVQYVKICSLYGAGFYYVPGMDVCVNPTTRDARQQTIGGTWRSQWPYPDGRWVARTRQDCKNGKVAFIGTFHSTDFTLNAWDRKQTAPVALPLTQDQFISRVYMSGGFYDPRVPGRSGTNSSTGFCVRSIDPTVLEQQGSGDPVNPPWGDGGLPIGCIANSRIVNMPAAYAITATAAYPQIDTYFPTADQSIVAGPYLYGSQLVISTDLGNGGEFLLTYMDKVDNTVKPLAGTLSVSVCVQRGLQDVAGIAGEGSSQ